MEALVARMPVRAVAESEVSADCSPRCYVVAAASHPLSSRRRVLVAAAASGGGEVVVVPQRCATGSYARDGSVKREDENMNDAFASR